MRMVIDQYLTRRFYNDSDQLHSTDGPAVINYLSGERKYYINGIEYSKDEYWDKIYNEEALKCKQQ